MWPCASDAIWIDGTNIDYPKGDSLGRLIRSKNGEYVAYFGMRREISDNYQTPDYYFFSVYDNTGKKISSGEIPLAKYDSNLKSTVFQYPTETLGRTSIPRLPMMAYSSSRYKMI